MFSSAASAALAVMLAFTTGCLQETDSASIESIDGAEHEEGAVPEDLPDLDTAEYVADVDFVSDEEFDTALAACHAQAAERPMNATDEELAASDDESRGVMVLADGRVYRATASEPSYGGLERLRVPAKVLAPVSQVTWTGIYLGIVGQTPANEPADHRQLQEHGQDHVRWRMVGERGHRRAQARSHRGAQRVRDELERHARKRQSAIAEGRHDPFCPGREDLLHDGMDDLTAASSNQSVVRHDYALLVTTATIATGSNQNGGFFDVNYYLNSSDLLAGTYNLYGYPGSTLACAAAPVKEPTWYNSKFGKCGDALYGMSGSVVDAPTSMAQHDLDVQPGQSGAALYEYYSDTGRRVVRGIQSIHVPNYGGYAHQINSESRTNINSWISANP